jgi:hypothetical protein
VHCLSNCNEQRDAAKCIAFHQDDGISSELLQNPFMVSKSRFQRLILELPTPTSLSFHSVLPPQPRQAEGCRPVPRLPSTRWYFIWTLADSYFAISNKVAMVAWESPTSTSLTFHIILPQQLWWAEGRCQVHRFPSRWWYFIWTLAKSFSCITNKVATVAWELPTTTSLPFCSALPQQLRWVEGRCQVHRFPSRRWYFIWTLAKSFYGIEIKVSMVDFWVAYSYITIVS